MRAAVFILVVALGVASGSEIAPRFPPGWCTGAGDVVCSADCSAIQVCIPDQPGTYINEVVETCPSGSSCYRPNLQTVECSYEFSLCQDERNFTCTGIGSFPDQIDCRVYHVCLDTGHTRYTCPTGYGYNSYTKSCSVALDPAPRICAVSPVPKCEDVGQAGALCENESLYYLCFRDETGLWSKIYECPNGFIFDEELFDCVPPAMKASNVVNGCQYLGIET